MRRSGGVAIRSNMTRSWTSWFLLSMPHSPSYRSSCLMKTDREGWFTSGKYYLHQLCRLSLAFLPSHWIKIDHTCVSVYAKPIIFVLWKTCLILASPCEIQILTTFETPVKFKLTLIYSWSIVKTAGLRQIITKEKTSWACFPHLAAEVWLADVIPDINQFEKVNNKNIARWILAHIIWIIKTTVTFQSSVDADNGLYSNHWHHFSGSLIPHYIIMLYWLCLGQSIISLSMTCTFSH